MEQDNSERSRASETLVGVALLLMIGAGTTPTFEPARTKADEMRALRGLHAISTAQIQYFSTYGRYADTLAELGPPAEGAPSSAAADLIPKSLSSGVHAGYVYEMRMIPTGYSANASPQEQETAGLRAFYTDQTNVIRYRSDGEPASGEDPPIQQTRAVSR